MPDEEPVLTWDDAFRAAGTVPVTARDLYKSFLPQDSGSTGTTIETDLDEWYLSHIEITGHVGIGQATVAINLTPAPGILVVSAPNGTGKTSIVHGLRRCLGDDPRTEDVLEDNLHHDIRKISVVVSSGQRNANLTCNGTSSAVWNEDGVEGPFPSNWSRSFSRYQPILLYPQVAGIITDPSNLHDFLSSAISVDVLEELQSRIDTQRSSSRNAAKALKDERQALTKVMQSDDYKALREAVDAVSELPTPEQRKAITEAVNVLALQHSTSLPEIIDLSEPPVYDEAIDALVRTLESARSGIADGAETLREILQKLLAPDGSFADAKTTDTCPVCGATGRHWSEGAAEQEHRLTEALGAYDSAKRALADRIRLLKDLLPKVPSALDSLTSHGELGTVAQEVRTEWQRLEQVASILDPGTASASDVDAYLTSYVGLRQNRDDLVRHINELRSAQTGEDVGVKVVVEAWFAAIDEHGPAIRLAESSNSLKKWVDGQIKSTRGMLFQPISDGAKEIWNRLNPGGDLGLASIDVSGGTQRRQKILPHLSAGGVAVPSGADGVRVLSTGQRNALSLATYLPRSAQASSPFRFLVLDDPIQAFDGSRVSYLAAKLAELGKDFQVIIFTHDERLWSELSAISANARRVVLRRRSDAKSHVDVVEATSAGDVLLGELSAILTKYEAGNDVQATEEAVTALVLAVCRQALDAELVQQLGVLGRRRGMDLDGMAEDLERSSQTRDRLRMWIDYCVACGMTAPECARFSETVDVLNQASHGQSPNGVTQLQRRGWQNETAELIRLIGESSVQVDI